MYDAFYYGRGDKRVSGSPDYHQLSGNVTTDHEHLRDHMSVSLMCFANLYNIGTSLIK